MEGGISHNPIISAVMDDEVQKTPFNPAPVEAPYNEASSEPVPHINLFMCGQRSWSTLTSPRVNTLWCVSMRNICTPQSFP